MSQSTSEIEAKILEVNSSQIIETLEKINATKILDELTIVETFESPVSEIITLSSPEGLNLSEMIDSMQLITNNFKNTLDSLGAYLRIRQQGGKLEFTLKYKLPESNGNYKIEKEVNIALDNNTEIILRSWLRENSFTPISLEKKYRISYIHNETGARIDIDTWQKPVIPTYIEIEADNLETIEFIASLLGYQKSSLSGISGKELFKKYNATRSL